MAVCARMQEIARDSFEAAMVVFDFALATLQELRSGQPTTAWELVRAIG